MPDTITADYGLDAPRDVRNLAIRGGVALVAAGVMTLTNPGIKSPLIGMAWATGIILLGVAAVMIWSSRVAKMKVRDQMLDKIHWRGDEQVLDVGCGRGLLLIGAAKRLKSGRATGVDLWSQEDLGKNSPEATAANAKVEGVAQKVKVESADARSLPFRDESFDVVLSSTAIHNISGKEERAKALAEIVRVLKPGGRVAIFDIFHTTAYAAELARLGLTDIELSSWSLLWCVPSRQLFASKPLRG